MRPQSFPIDLAGASLSAGNVAVARTTAIRYASALAPSEGAPLATLVLGHGAGAPQTHPWMVGMSRALSERGLDVVTFDFLYAAAGRRAPDKNDVLEATWRAVLRAVLADGPAPLRARARVFIGGKSMGGRIATQVAAAGEPGISGVVLFGYPLHPPGKPEQLRAAHLARVSVPLLFVQGSRDPFGSPEELAPHVRGLAAGTRVHVVEGGDHSLAVRKKAGHRADDVVARVADEVVRFVTSAGPPT